MNLPADGVENDIAICYRIGEILKIVGNRMCAELLNDINVGGIAGRINIGAEMLRNLDGHRSDTPRPTVNQDPHPCVYLRRIDHCVPGRQAHQRNRSGLL